MYEFLVVERQKLHVVVVTVGVDLHSFQYLCSATGLGTGLGTGDCSEDESYSYDFAPDGGIFLDGTYQVIKWTAHPPTKWATLIDETGKDL